MKPSKAAMEVAEAIADIFMDIAVEGGGTISSGGRERMKAILGPQAASLIDAHPMVKGLRDYAFSVPPGCWVCGGDCASANPPVPDYACPLKQQDALSNWQPQPEKEDE